MNMKKQTNTNLILRSCLAVVLALAIWTPAPAQSAEPEKGQMMMGGKMMADTNLMQQCQAMKEQKAKLMADIKAQDAELTAQVAAMNSAPENQKLGLMAAIVTRMVEQRTAMDARKAKMEEAMMQHMMQHMQMGKESLSQCPMMKGMKTMKAMGEKSGDAEEK
jgi:predicted component of type VI protein secretion system